MSKAEWFDGAKNPPKEGEWIWSRSKSNLTKSYYMCVGQLDEWRGFFWTPAPAPPEFVPPEPPMPEANWCHGMAPDIRRRHPDLPEQFFSVHCMRTLCPNRAEHADKRSAILGWNAMQGAQ